MNVTFSLIRWKKNLMLASLLVLPLAAPVSPVLAMPWGGQKQAAGGQHPLGRLMQQLGLSEEQKEKLIPLIKAHHQTMKGIREQGLAPEQKREQVKAELEKLKAAVTPILTPAQLAQAQDFIQNRVPVRHQKGEGGGPLRQVLDQLGLSEDQKKQLHENMKAHRDERQAHRQEMQGLAPEERKARRQEMRQKMEAELGKVLTPEQMTKLRTLLDEKKGRMGHQE